MQKSQMRFHVVGLPHTNTTDAFSSCAFTNKVRGFCEMMFSLGHEVFLYAGMENSAPCTEHISCINEELRKEAVGDKPYVEASWDTSLPHWMIFNANAIREINRRKSKRDFLCLIGGIAQKPIADKVGLMTVEFGVGYGGTFANHRVYESYAWMHTCYGSSNTNPHAIDGRWFDTVIPGYLDLKNFPYQTEKEDYCLFVGRIIDRKGIHIAAKAAEAAGYPLVVAGPGVAPTGTQHVGMVGPEERGRLMAGARCLLAPSIYLEPFGNVAIEAMACGTPAITSDWGAFTETNIDNITGFRCRSMGEFVEGIRLAHRLRPNDIRLHVKNNYSLDVIRHKYDAYFRRLMTLWGKGFEDLTPPSRLGYNAPTEQKQDDTQESTADVKRGEPCLPSESKSAPRQSSRPRRVSVPKSHAKPRKKRSRNS